MPGPGRRTELAGEVEQGPARATEVVQLMPRIGGGPKAQLFGELADVLAVCDEVGQKRHEQPISKETGCQVSVVAEARNRFCLLLLTARLPLSQRG